MTRPSPRRGQGGYILAATIWFVAALAISVAYYALWMQRQVDGWQAALDDAAGEGALRGQLATSLYRVLTAPREPGGLVLPDGRVVHVDGRAYETPDGVGFAIMDLSGLISINGASGDGVRRLLTDQGIPATQVGALVARLLDYTDFDATLRPNGVEYLRGEGRSVPNRPLSYPREVFEVPAWDAALEPRLQRHLLEHTTIYGPILLNLNAAPRAVLRTVPWLSDPAVERLLAVRQQAAFASLADFRTRVGIGAGVGIDSQLYTVYPSRFLRIAAWRKGETRELRLNLRITRGSERAGPWLLDYAGWAPIPAWRRTTEEQQ